MEPAALCAGAVARPSGRAPFRLVTPSLTVGLLPRSTTQRRVPLVSVIMPVRNEANFIERSVGAVLAQDYPRERLEILIADGMSNDGTREVISSLQQAHANVKLIDNPDGIVSAGLNAALRQAKGDDRRSHRWPLRSCFRLRETLRRAPVERRSECALVVRWKQLASR